MLPPINNFPSRKEWENACWRKILESKDLLQLLISAHERRRLVLRAAALEGLASGKSYRQVSKELWLSLQTISGVKKVVSEKEYRSYLERSKKERKKKKYSGIGLLPPKPKKPKGRPQRTKYGTIYMPR